MREADLLPATKAAMARRLGVDLILGDVRQELLAAMVRFAPMHSPHEGIAVIEEEYIELRKHVHENTGRGPGARAEAIQLAAMAIRYVADLYDGRVA